VIIATATAIPTSTDVPVPTPTPAPTVAPPPAPTGLGAFAQACNQVLLVWQYNSNAAVGFYIYRAGQFIGGISVETKYFTDWGLQPDTLYRYTVTAWNAGGESRPSPPVEVRTHPASQTCP